jgi:hypothetical protein
MSDFEKDAGVAVEIGGMPIFLRTTDPSFRQLLESRYRGFLSESGEPRYSFDIDLGDPVPGTEAGDPELKVAFRNGQWLLRRGDFDAQLDPRSARGRVRQPASPYSIDSVLRIVHTLILAREGGFLMHAASGIRNGRAYLFAGVSGAGKTTISRLAPPDATLLSDEISYVRRDGPGYVACGTPFSGELAESGENQCAAIGTVLLLHQGPENRIDDVEPQDAVRSLLRNILFFAEDAELVRLVFQSACEFTARVPVRRLTFTPDQRVWEMIGTQ